MPKEFIVNIGYKYYCIPSEDAHMLAQIQDRAIPAEYKSGSKFLVDPTKDGDFITSLSLEEIELPPEPDADEAADGTWIQPPAPVPLADDITF